MTFLTFNKIRFKTFRVDLRVVVTEEFSDLNFEFINIFQGIFSKFPGLPWPVGGMFLRDINNLFTFNQPILKIHKVVLRLLG